MKTVIILMGIAGAIILNIAISIGTLAVCRILQSTPEKERDALSKKQPIKLEKDSWAGPQKSSYLTVAVSWIFFISGLALVVLGASAAGLDQKVFIIIGACIMLFSLMINFTAMMLAGAVLRAIQNEKKSAENPAPEKKLKDRKILGLPIKI